MKKLAAATIAAALLAIAAPSIQATDLPAAFKVTATLTPTCQLNGAVANLDFGNYTSFVGPEFSAPTTTVNIECSKGVTLLSAVLSGGTGTVVGISYTLTTGAPVLAAAPGPNGGAAWSYTVTGSIPAGQAGDSTAPLEDTRTLTITY